MSKATLRSKVEEFFNPGPSLDAEDADSNDSHQLRSFKKPGSHIADMPRRKLLPDIEIDPKFQAKTVTRKELDHSDTSSDGYGDESFEEEVESELSSEISDGPNLGKMDD
jgi:hypothetical protein